MRDLRLVLALIGLLIPAVLLLNRGSTAPDNNQLPATVPLQEQLGPWRAGDSSALNFATLKILDPDAYVLTRYDQPDHKSIWLYAGFYLHRRSFGNGAHDPAVCYPAQGWEVTSTTTVEIPIGRGSSAPAQLLTAERDNEREDVLYWFQPMGRWPVTGVREELLRMVDAVRGRSGHAFVRLSSIHDEQNGPQDLIRFASAMAPLIRERIETTAR